jgi:hypothetical protein
MGQNDAAEIPWENDGTELGIFGTIRTTGLKRRTPSDGIALFSRVQGEYPLSGLFSWLLVRWSDTPHVATIRQ